MLVNRSLSFALRISCPKRVCFSSGYKGETPLFNYKQTRTASKIATSDPYPAYEFLEGIERLDNYRTGGYHPIQIGDHFHGRYRVVHKLGHGSYSTVWLACDEHANKYVALKFCTADASTEEVEMISALTRPGCLPPKHHGKEMLPSILDKFAINGPNGNHVCYVSTSARVTLAGAKDGSWIRLFQLDVARSLAAQLVLVVDYVHSQGIVHGDLHLGNIFIKIPPNFNQLSLSELYEEYGEPETDPVVRFDGEPLSPGVPSHGTAPIWLGKETLVNLSSPRKSRGTSLVPPLPAVLQKSNNPLSFPSDIWSLACVIWSIIAQRPLFEGFFATDDDITREHVDALGILPPEWWEKWETRSLKFTEDGKPIYRNPYRSWEDRFEDSVRQPRLERDLQTFDEREKKAFFDILRPMFSFRPEERPTTKQILQSEWMVMWAMSEYAKTRD